MCVPQKEGRQRRSIRPITRCRRRYDTPNTKAELVKGKPLAIEQNKEKLTILESQVNEPVTEKESSKFLKFLKHSKYSVVQQLHNNYS
ncbi:hypothetical protein J1N35_011459 [Gossypium stocksii]|uniref:Uncharacterized protein n=1 Tax=Gossypium stocksii TaxID=47602 RepID=A0A9D3W2J3_9ROSI|nr:hypothetical protein J1N35_011459 [Gossypium stocksii]